jgi:hypothetical protein
VKRHDVDPTSLVAGFVFVIIGAIYLVAALTDSDLDARWLLPVLLIGLGIAGLAGSINLVRRAGDD